jgi:hypothetical protein
VLGAPSVSFGDGRAQLRRRLVFVLRLIRRAFVSGWFFISGRFVKSVKVGIHRRDTVFSVKPKLVCSFRAQRGMDALDAIRDRASVAQKLVTLMRLRRPRRTAART